MTMTCLELAQKASGGKLTDKELLDAFEQEQKIREAFIDAGKTDNLDARVANRIAQIAMDKKVEAARLKREIAQNIKVRASLSADLASMMGNGTSPVKSINTMWTGSATYRTHGDAMARAYENKWAGAIMSKVQAERPHIFKLFSDRAFDNDVTRELMELRKGGTPGKTGNSDAQFLAHILASVMEMARTEMNKMGAAIGKLDGYAGPQIHDDMKMIRVGVNEWIDDILPLLDLSKTFPDIANEAEARGILDGSFNTIITGVSDEASPLLRGEPVRPGNMAKRLGKHRVFHFKDAEAAMAYRDKYGRGSTIQGIMGMLQRQSRTAGALEKFGPNPKAMVNSIAAKARLDLKAKIATMPPGKAKDKMVKWSDGLASADGEVASLKAMLDDVTGLLQRPVNVRAAEINDGIRAWLSLAKLGSAVITAMPTDFVTTGLASQFRGSGFIRGLHRTMSQLANRKDGKEIAYLLGEGFDGITGHLASAFADGGPGVLSRTMQNFFKWNGLSGWTDTMRAVSARVIAAELGSNAGKAFGDLHGNLRHVLKLNGITEAKWEAMRTAGARLDNGHTYITPDLARNISDDEVAKVAADKIAEAKASILKPTKAGNITQNMLDKFEKKKARIIEDMRHEIEMDFHRYYADETSNAIIETDAKSRRLTTWGTRPGTMAGETVRYMMQFKGFPTAFTQRVLGRAVFNAPGGAAQQAVHMGTIIASLTIAGYAAMTAKDVFRGKWPPRDPLSPKTLAAAAMQGGALGVYGDFIFSEASRFNQSPLETVMGPGIGTASDIVNWFNNAKVGDADGARALDIFINNTPFINLFYTRPALDFLILNAAREALRPGTLQRQEQNLRKRFGQEYVVPRTLGEVMR